MALPNNSRNFKGNTNFNNGGNANQKQVIALTSAYKQSLSSGYFIKGANGLKSIKKELIVDFAMENADLFGKAKVATTQIRAFYDQVKQVETNIKLNKNLDFNQLMTSIYALLGIVHSKCQKQILHPVFEEFLKLNINQIHNIEDIKAFEQHFKATVCFMPQKKN